MGNNEIVRKHSFEEKLAYFKKNIKDFFSTYKNKSGGEDCIEVCLIRAGYRTVLQAEEEIDRLQDEIESLRNAYKQCAWERDVFYDNAVRLDIEREESQYTRTVGMISDMELAIEKAKAEAYKEFADEAKKRTGMDYLIDELLEEKLGENNDT